MPFPFLIPLIGAALGAGTGALVDKNNRGRGALIGGLTGGAAGFGAGKLPALAKLGGGAAKAASGIGGAIPEAAGGTLSMMPGAESPQLLAALESRAGQIMGGANLPPLENFGGAQGLDALAQNPLKQGYKRLKGLSGMLPRRQQQQPQQLPPINVSMMDSQINPMGYPRQGGFFRG